MPDRISLCPSSRVIRPETPDRASRISVRRLLAAVAHSQCGIAIRLAVREKNQNVRSYAVVIHEDPEGGFWAEVPALPGCYSQGETVDELKHNIREAIAGVLEILREEGREPDSNIQMLDVAV